MKPTVVTLDPLNEKHRQFIHTVLAARGAPVVIAPDSLKVGDTKPQKVLTVADLENIRAAEEKRERRALKRK
jgi:hypothetical protein